MVILLWVVIGLGAGWATGAVMLGRNSQPSRELAAGLMGAFVGPLIVQFSDPVMRVTVLNGSLGALAGALWLAGIVCVVTSGDVRAISLDEETKWSPIEAHATR
jgi:uncharacterized membrane protein YeaQ/YmgE (transglycosylase-associated protein family)